MGSCGDCRGSPDQQQNIFFIQTEIPQTIPFGTGIETTVLTLPVQITGNVVPVLINGLVQMQITLPQGLTFYQYGIRLRIRRNGNLLFTQTMLTSNDNTPNLTHTHIHTIPISIVDNNPAPGNNIYTITLEYYQQSSATITVTAQSRTINALLTV